MFTSKIKFLHLVSVGGKRGWSGSLTDWNVTREHELYKKSLTAMRKSFSEVWK